MSVKCDASPIEDYYAHAEALEFIRDCEGRGTRILGVDILLKQPGRITPLNSTAWPDELSAEESWREARLLIAHGIPDGGNVVAFTTDPN